MFEIVSKLKLKVSINENQVAGLKSGNTVAVTASVYPDTKFAGKSHSLLQWQIQA
jgi:multidrug resistance efflux pump